MKKSVSPVVRKVFIRQQDLGGGNKLLLNDIQKIYFSFALFPRFFYSKNKINYNFPFPCFLLLLAFMYSQQATALGRLFMTPIQRVELEQNKIATPSPKQNEEQNPQTIHINGFIKPKHSASTIWVNGQVRSNKAKKEYYVRQWISPSHQISIDLQGTRASLRPGQTLDLKNRVVKEAFALTPQIESDLKAKTEDTQETNQIDVDTNKTLSVLQQAKEINTAIADANVE